LLYFLLRDLWVIGLLTTQPRFSDSTPLTHLTLMFVSVFSNEDLDGKNLYSLFKLDQIDKSLHEYTNKFNNSYSHWKNDISVKFAAYLYIGGHKNGSVRKDFMTN